MEQMSKYRRDDSEEYRIARAQTLKRDNYQCQMCDTKKGKLNVHHIIEWSENVYLRTDTDNLITLCWRCHRDIRGKEKHYRALFTSIVYQNKEKK